MGIRRSFSQNYRKSKMTLSFKIYIREDWGRQAGMAGRMGDAEVKKKTCLIYYLYIFQFMALCAT